MTDRSFKFNHDVVEIWMWMKVIIRRRSIEGVLSMRRFRRTDTIWEKLGTSYLPQATELVSTLFMSVPFRLLDFNFLVRYSQTGNNNAEERVQKRNEWKLHDDGRTGHHMVHGLSCI